MPECHLIKGCTSHLSLQQQLTEDLCYRLVGVMCIGLLPVWLAGALVSACCDAAVMHAVSVTVCLAVALLGRADQYSLRAALYGRQCLASIPGLEVSLEIHSMMPLFRTVTPSKGAWMAPSFSASMSEYLGLRFTARTRSASAQELCACMST